MKASNLLVALALSFVVPGVGAQAAGAFAGEHMLNTLKIQECRLVYALGTTKASSGEVSAMDAYKSFLKCRSEAIEQISGTRKKMATKLKSASQRADNKEYQVAITLALEGSESRDGELNFQYKTRLARLDEDVERAWQRLSLD